MPNEENKGGNILGMIPGAIATIGGMLGIGQKKQDRRQLEQQAKLSQQAADINYNTQMKMWKETNFPAQVEQLKMAGLNPALLYGKGGGGGATVGGTIAGGMASNAAQAQQANTAATAGMGMLPAQIELIKAQTENVKADTASKGADPALKEAQTASLTQGIENQKAVAELTKIETELKGIEKTIQGGTIHDQMNTIMRESEIAEGKAASAMAQGNVDENTMQTKIDILKQESINLGIQAAMMNSNIEVNDAKINEISNGILQKWKEISQQGSKNRYEHEDRLTAIREYTANALKTAGIIAAGNIAGDIVKIATRQIPKGHTTTTIGDKGSSWSETTYK